jgi:hypothetical protein
MKGPVKYVIEIGEVKTQIGGENINFKIDSLMSHVLLKLKLINFDILDGLEKYYRNDIFHEIVHKLQQPETGKKSSHNSKSHQDDL